VIKLSRIKAEPSVHSVQLSVTQSGMVVSVAAGLIKFCRQGYEIFETDYTAKNVDHDVSVTGWLVKDEAGDALIAVDENSEDGVFDWATCPYEKLDVLFQFGIPANTSSLDDVEISVRHLVAPPSRGARAPLSDEQMDVREALARAKTDAEDAVKRAKEEARDRARAEQAARDDARRAERPAVSTHTRR